MKKVILIIFILFFLLLFSVSMFSETIVLKDINKPENIIIDQGQILITEFPNVYVYSIEDYSLIAKFGKEGEGPREFHQYVRIQYKPEDPQYIIVGSHMKVSYFTRKGEFVKEIRSKTSTTANVYKPLGDKFVSYGFKQQDKANFVTVNIFDKNMNKLKEILSWEAVFQPGEAKFNPTDNDLSGGEFRIFKGRIYILLRECGTIHIFDNSGEKIKTISHKYESVNFTSKDRKSVDNHYKTHPRWRRAYQRFLQKFQYPTHYPCTRGFTVDEKIYVLTWEKSEGKYKLVVFNGDGKFLENLHVNVEDMNAIEFYPYWIHGGKIYQIIDNGDTEEWELHINDIK